MSDSKRRFRAIRQALNTIYPEPPTDNKAHYLNTLASMICGTLCHVNRVIENVKGVLKK
jgi:hypothetical protein